MNHDPCGVTILVPTRNRPRQLARLLDFLSITGNTYSVRVLDGSAPNTQALNANIVAEHDFAIHDTYDPQLHLGLRCADGLRKVDTAHTVFCADDDFVFPEALARCAQFLADHPDHSAVSGTFLSLNYLPNKPLMRRGVMLNNPFQFIGYTGHLVAGVWLGNDDSSPTKKTTGGGIPVEIWSKFMKAAHQGVPVVGLPGTPSAPLTASFTPFGGSRIAPPAPVSNSEGPVQAASADGGTDNWLINRLFGRR